MLFRSWTGLTALTEGALVDPVTPAWTPPKALVDLRALCQAAPRPVEDGEVVPRRRVSLLDTVPKRVVAEPLEVTLALDGIQRELLLTRREHRPIVLAYTAAGAFEAPRGPLQEFEQHLLLVCSHLDEAYVRTLPGGCREFVVLEENDPADIGVAASEAVGALRADSENRVASALRLASDEALLVDGSISRLAAPDHGAIVGVAKTTGTQWLLDEPGLSPLGVLTADVVDRRGAPA